MGKLICQCVALSVALFVIAGCVTTGNVAEPAAAPRDSETALRSVEQANAALARSDFEGALMLFQRALRHDPENRHAKLGLAESYLGLGAYQEALRGFRELGEDPEVGISALQGKGIVLLLLAEHEKAYAALSAAVAEQPDMWRAWNALGRYHDSNQDWAEAENAYRRAMAVAPEPSRSVVHNNWGVSAMAQGRYAEAAQHLTTAVGGDKGLAVAEANLRLALALQGRYAEAMSGIASGDRAGTLNNLGFVAMMRGDHARAEAYFLRALESSPKFHETASKNLQFLASMKQIHSAGNGRSLEEATAQ